MTSGLRSVRHCLVTGASGFIGRVLCDRLRSEGVRVRVLLRQPAAGPWDEVYQGDLLDPATIPNDIFSGIDTVFYLAAIAHRYATPLEYLQLNTDACLQFARRAAESGVSGFVFFSSSKAVSEDSSRIISEEDTAWPVDSYGLSKRQAEEGLLAIKSLSHLAILRPTLVYGPGVKGNLHSMLKAIYKGWLPAMPKTPARRSMVSVHSVADAAWRVAIHPTAHHQVYFLADEQPYAIGEIEAAIRQILGKSAAGWPIPNYIWRLANSIGVKSVGKLMRNCMYSASKIQNQLEWQPLETFYDALPEMKDSFLRYQEANK